MSLNKILFGFIRVAFSIMVALFVFYFGMNAVTTAYDFGYRVFTEGAVSSEPGRDVLVTVSEEMTAVELGELLEEKHLVRDGNLFAVQLELSIYSMKESAKKKQILPGTYTLNTSMTSKEMMAIMATVPEVETETEEPAAASTETGSEQASEAKAD